MRAATYNLRFGGLGGRRDHWEAIAEAHDPDVWLLQECAAPEEYRSATEPGGGVIWRPVEGMTWGTGVVSRYPITRELIITGFEGWVVGAEIDMGEDGLVQVFSVHVPSGRGSYAKVAHRLLDGISDSGFAPSIIGGDFNVGVGLRSDAELMRTTSAERKLLERFREEFDLVPAWQGLHPESPLPQTLRWSGNQEAPYHCDGFFVPPQWLREGAGCEVLAGDDWSRLSDHYPVVAQFTVAASGASSRSVPARGNGS